MGAYVLSAASALLLVGGCSNSQQSSEKTAKQSGKKQSSEKSSSKKSSSKKTVKKQSSESSSSEASSSSSSSQASQESSSSSASSQSSSSAASSSSSSQTQKYADEEYAAAVWLTGENAKYGFSESSVFYHSDKVANMYIYQGQKYANQTHITVNANDVLVEYDVVPGAHPHGMDQKTFTKEELNKTIAQHKQEIDDYISEQGSNQDEDY
ncbi:hypothetical protein FYJ61_04685 [Lactobacillus equicursoris]|uniref:Uncharacterized protein n=1 Tax=Lactobacillus equicursoris TaxID=420645 RepID=A0A844FN40_9LACO|nr:hypothetical protein [Lactobacillus equicursoris]MST79777.1 hypothetical protein [Lactobacillus equicursoris]